MSLQLQPKFKPHRQCDKCGISGDVCSLRLIEIFSCCEEAGNEMLPKKQLCAHCVVGHEIPVCVQSDSWVFGEIIRYDSLRPQWPFLASISDGCSRGEEWVDITERPFVDYLSFINGAARTQQATTCMSECPAPGRLSEFCFSHELNQIFASLSSFSSSTQQATASVGECPAPDRLSEFRFNHEPSHPIFTSLSSFNSSWSFGSFELTTGPSTYPLFNDEKLFDAEDLMFVDDDTDIPKQCDGEGAEASTLSESDDNEVFTRPPVKRKRQVKSTKTPKRKASSTQVKAVRTPRRWTKEEDLLLKRIVASYEKQEVALKWPEVAAKISNRSGKQCRERYVNHLSPTLRPKIWNASEDAMIIHLFLKHGTHWSKTAGYFQGRTDNSCKNRFHHLRRMVERDYRKRYGDDEECMSNNDMAESFRHKVQRMMVDIATDSKASRRSMHGKYKFGVLKEVKQITSCKRCCLFVPSAHTGTKVCSLTGWCEACVHIPTYVMGDDLRACLSQRMAQDDFMLE